MRKLNSKIVEKLAKDLGRSPRTIRNNITKLAPDYPSLTINARAQIYARKNGKTVLRMLDEEDTASLPKHTISTPHSVAKPAKTNNYIKLVQVSENPDSYLNKWWVQLIFAFLSFLFTGVVAGTIAQILGIYLAVQWGITN